MPWYCAALLAAVCDSIRDLLTKGSLAELSTGLVAWLVAFFSIPVLGLALFAKGLPSVDSSFYSIGLLERSPKIMARS